ncbi:MAG: hypothetical protein LBR45_04885, partial [Bacteroidales bacterium]|nr:hypothetical protein [Bacteroidales bacterium]
MTLIKSISGIRGTIGGKVGENLTPVDIVKFSAAFAAILQKKNAGSSAAGIGDKNAGSPITMLVGRDGRISGEMVQQLVVSTLCGMGANVVDVGLSTTPTVEMEVVRHKAQGGIIITASHNPKEWNALKLLGASGEFISAEEGAEVLRLAETVGQADNTEQYEKLQQPENAEQTKTATIEFASVDKLGSRTVISDAIEKHIEKILQLPLVNTKDIAKQNFKVV